MTYVPTKIRKNDIFARIIAAGFNSASFYIFVQNTFSSELANASTLQNLRLFLARAVGSLQDDGLYLFWLSRPPSKDILIKPITL